MDRYDRAKELCGHSFWGTPLYCERIGAGKTALLFTGDFGADGRCEGVVSRFAKDLEDCARADLAPVGKVGMGRLLSVRSVCFWSCPNPDGKRIKEGGLAPDSPFFPRVNRLLGKKPAALWTANGRGIDPGRNFNYAFEQYKDSCQTGPAPFGHCGIFPESEPESASFAALVRRTVPRLLVHLTSGPCGLCYREEDRGLDGICVRYAPFEKRSADLSATPEGWAFRELGCSYLRIFLGKEEEERSYRLLRPLLFALTAY
jgi:hypothetical protein